MARLKNVWFDSPWHLDRAVVRGIFVDDVVSRMVILRSVL
jgi:hypothetical protein